MDDSAELDASSPPKVVAALSRRDRLLLGVRSYALPSRPASWSGIERKVAESVGEP